MSKFDIALYKNREEMERISVNQLTNDLYNSKFREKLFCPNMSCSARLVFVEWESTQTRFFRTWNGDTHVEGCNYSVVYDEENYSKRNYDFVKLNISDDHILRRLESAYNGLNETKKKPLVNDDKKVKHITGSNMEDEESIGGRASLFDEGVSNESGKEPRIEKRFCEMISSDDNDQVRCIIGKIHSIHIKEDHAYINLTPMQYEAISIFLNPSFKKDFSGMFDGLAFLKSYVELNKKKNKQVTICCVGLVKLLRNEKVEWKYQIGVDRALALSFDGKSYYELVRESARNKLKTSPNIY